VGDDRQPGAEIDRADEKVLYQAASARQPFEDQEHADAGDQDPGRVGPPDDLRQGDEDPLERRRVGGSELVGDDAVVEQQHGQRDEERDLDDQAPRRIVAQQDMGEKRANQGEHSGLDELIGRDFGQVQTADHPRNHTVMPGCSPSVAATGSSLGRKLSRSWSPTARAARDRTTIPIESETTTAARGVLRGGAGTSDDLPPLPRTRPRGAERGVSRGGKRCPAGTPPANATTPRGYLHLACNARGLDDRRRRHKATKWLRFSARRPTVVTEGRRRVDGARAPYGAA